MVDVSDKPVTHRTATATGSIQVSPEIMAAVKSGNVKKGDVLGVARVAGIMGVKRTSELIPMCHPLPIQKCSVDFETDEDAGVIRVFCTVKTEGKTGVEMEALTGVQVTLLTIMTCARQLTSTWSCLISIWKKKQEAKAEIFVLRKNNDRQVRKKY